MIGDRNGAAKSGLAASPEGSLRRGALMDQRVIGFAETDYRRAQRAEIRPTVLGQAEAPRSPVDQPDPHRPLERGEAARQPRHRHTGRARCRRQAGRFGGSDEQGEVGQPLDEIRVHCA